MRIFIATIFLVISPWLLADEPMTPIEKYRNSTQVYALTCNLNALILTQTAQLNDSTSIEKASIDFNNCLKEGKKETKSLLNKALVKLKNQDQKKLLKNYQLAFLNLLDGLKPKQGDIEILYKNRKNELESKMQSAWNEFELNAGE